MTPINEPLQRYLDAPSELTRSDAAQLSNWIRWLLLRRGCPAHALDDAVQDAWVRVSGHVHELRLADSAFSYLWQLVASSHVDSGKHAMATKRTAREGYDPADPMARFSPGGIEDAIYEREALSTLTAREREVVDLTLAGYEYEEVASRCGFDPNTTYKIRRRVVKQMEALWTNIAI